ncbi:hypothetical protein MS5N3_28750 [Marinobacter salsuginis]|uniref:Lipoprotein n=2 Tax=Marinobacteraceae TaxID=2887365 RepID=A0A5M3PRC5_9GAMM|nr:hypothetical protein MS5N3_28750 [Marinobacter salsuginis]
MGGSLMFRQFSWSLFTATFLLVGCASHADDEEMYVTASALTKVSSALEASVYFDTPPEGLQDRELLEFATKHDPSLLEPFDNFILKANYVDRHGVVLVCDELGRKALMKDLGCTAKLDKPYWDSTEVVPCRINPPSTVNCPVTE